MVGQMVHIKQDAPRSKWRMENIVELIESRDDEIRGTWLLLPNGNTIQPPINLLYPLETTPVKTIKQNVDDNCQKKNGANNISIEQKSKRKAVIRTKDRLKTLFNEEIGIFVRCRKCHQDREIKHAIKDWQVTGTFKNIWLHNEKLQEYFRIFKSVYKSEIETIDLFLETIVII